MATIRVPTVFEETYAKWSAAYDQQLNAPDYNIPDPLPKGWIDISEYEADAGWAEAIKDGCFQAEHPHLFSRVNRSDAHCEVSPIAEILGYEFQIPIQNGQIARHDDGATVHMFVEDIYELIPTLASLHPAYELPTIPPLPSERATFIQTRRHRYRLATPDISDSIAPGKLARHGFRALRYPGEFDPLAITHIVAHGLDQGQKPFGYSVLPFDYLRKGRAMRNRAPHHHHGPHSQELAHQQVPRHVSRQGVPLPQVPRPEVSHPQVPRQQMAYPQGPSQRIRYPQGSYHQGFYPQGSDLQGSYPHGFYPQGFYLQGSRQETSRQELPRPQGPRQQIPRQHFPHHQFINPPNPSQQVRYHQGSYPQGSRQEATRQEAYRQEHTRPQGPRQQAPHLQSPHQEVSYPSNPSHQVRYQKGSSYPQACLQRAGRAAMFDPIAMGGPSSFDSSSLGHRITDPSPSQIPPGFSLPSGNMSTSGTPKRQRIPSTSRRIKKQNVRERRSMSSLQPEQLISDPDSPIPSIESDDHDTAHGKNWSAYEKSCVENVVRGLRDEERRLNLVPVRDVNLWDVVSHRLAEVYNVRRTGYSCKSHWIRLGRDHARFDERVGHVYGVKRPPKAKKASKSSDGKVKAKEVPKKTGKTSKARGESTQVSAMK